MSGKIIGETPLTSGYIIILIRMKQALRDPDY